MFRGCHICILSLKHQCHCYSQARQSFLAVHSPLAAPLWDAGKATSILSKDPPGDCPWAHVTKAPLLLSWEERKGERPSFLGKAGAGHSWNRGENWCPPNSSAVDQLTARERPAGRERQRGMHCLRENQLTYETKGREALGSLTICLPLLSIGSLA